MAFILLVVIASVSLQAELLQTDQTNIFKTGIFEYKLPPGWVLDKEYTNEEFLSFRQVVVGKVQYIVRLRFRATLTSNICDLERHIGTNQICNLSGTILSLCGYLQKD